MKNHFLFLFVAFFFSGIILSLNSCVTTAKIKDWETAVRVKKYAVAIPLLEKEIEKTEEPVAKAKMVFTLAECHQAMNRTEEAARRYKEAAELGYRSEAILRYALMLKTLQQYDDAVKQFKRYLKEEPHLRSEVTRQINACENAAAWIARHPAYKIENMELANSPADDFCPVFLDGKKLAFTSSRPAATGEENDGWTGDKFYDIFVTSIMDENILSSAVLFEDFPYTEFHEGAVTFSSDYREMYFTACGDKKKKVKEKFCHIFYTFRQPDGTWNTPQLLSFFDDSTNVGSPCLSPDGKQLFMVADAPDAIGGMDIFVADRTADGWTFPKNIGVGVNTFKNEMFPYMHPDGTLYFSSDGHPGMGGLDIFSAKKVNGQWKDVQNLKYPINSGADDLGIIFVNQNFRTGDTLSMGYFTSSRPGGKGGDDLYRFVLEKIKLPPPVYVLKGKVLQRTGNPQDEATPAGEKPLPEAGVVIFNENNSEREVELFTDESGTFSWEIDSLTDYKITASKDPDYFTASKNITTKSRRGMPGETIEIEVEIVLDKIIEEKDIILENIYYDFDSTSLRSESFPSLDKLIKLLKENPSLKIEIGSHTDSRGSDEYNLTLSQGRAQSVVDYLKKNGVNNARLTAKGYGETKLINECTDGVECDEEAHQKNRRTTFSVKSERINIQSVVPDDIEVDPKKK